MVGPRLATAPDGVGLAAREASCHENLGRGGGWAEFSDCRRGLTVYAAGELPSLMEGLK